MTFAESFAKHAMGSGKGQSYCPHVPTEKQRQFLSLPSREGFFGGQVGGGKSDALLMGALEHVGTPGYAALILRRTYADLSLPGAIMDRAESWLINTDAKWNGSEKTWTFPSGAKLTFGYLEGEKDKYRYQSSEFQFIGFDELTQFSETQYTYLFSRLRKTLALDVPLRMRAASNPGGEGHEWVKERFIDHQTPERMFIPAGMDDNPYLDVVAYREALAELDPVTRAQLEHGDWEVRPQGPVFKEEWFTRIDAMPPLDLWVRYYDLAVGVKKENDFTAGALVGVRENGALVIAHMERWKREWPETRDGVRENGLVSEPGIIGNVRLDTERILEVYDPLRHSRKPNLIVGVEAQGTQLGFVQDLHRNDEFLKVPLYGIPAIGEKKERAATWQARAASKGIELVRGRWNSGFISECVAFNGKERKHGGSHDDQVDAVSGAVELLAKHRGGESERKPLPQPGSPEFYKRLVQQQQSLSRRS